MKNFKKRFSVLFVVVAVFLAFTLGTYAESLRETITATLTKDVKITYNGEEYVARDANRNITYPIIYNGTTYLPVRGIATLYGSKVTWDGATKTVGLWSPDYVPESNDDYIPESEMNNGFKTANTFELNGKVKGTIGDTFTDTNDFDEYDYYKVVAKETGIITFTVHADVESGLEFEFRNKDDEQFDNINLTDENSLTYEAAIEPGTYYVRILTDTKVAYKMENTFESLNNSGEAYNDSMDTAGLLPIDTSVKGTLSGLQEYYADDSEDYYKFEEPLNAITVELNHATTASLRVYIYNTNGETLESYDSVYGKLHATYVSEEGSDQIGFISVEGGDDPYTLYTLKVTEE